MADSTISDLAAVTDLLTTDDYVLMRSGVTKRITGDDLATEILALAPGGGGLFDAYAHLRDEKTSGTDGGTFTSGAWQTRTLNTEAFDTASMVSLSSNQFTLGAGTYFVRAYALVYIVDGHRLKIRNVTDSTDTLIGGSHHAQSNAAVANPAFVSGRFTIAGTKAFELQHRCQTTKATNGFGTNSAFGVSEVYAEVEIWREA